MQNVVYNKNNPFLSSIIEKTSLGMPGSNNNVYNVVLDLKKSGFSYNCGDYLGVYPQNQSRHVIQLLKLINISKEKNISTCGTKRLIKLKDALKLHYSMNKINQKTLFFLKLIDRYESLNAQEAILIDMHAEGKKKYINKINLINLLNQYSSIEITSQMLINVMNTLSPRLYSIASSPTIHPDSIHLTVKTMKYLCCNKCYHGSTSSYLTKVIDRGIFPISVFPVKSSFNLPLDDSIDIIMIGSGTGIAPFRSFIEERMARSATGLNWLFFGEQKEITDFFYKKDWYFWLKIGILTRLDLAFSRNKEYKVYIHHRMLEKSSEIWRWIKNQAYCYVCGNSKSMSLGVEKALVTIFQNEGKMSFGGAKIFVKKLKNNKRYQRDVY